MKYRIHRDPLFLLCAIIYCANRWVLKPSVSLEFFRSYLNDLICIPFCAPIMVALLRMVRLRGDDGPPRAQEVLIPLILWSVVFEVLLPGIEPFRSVVVADPVDIVCYSAGALVAVLFWNWWYSTQSMDGAARDAWRLAPRAMAQQSPPAPYEACGSDPTADALACGPVPGCGGEGLRTRRRPRSSRLGLPVPAVCQNDDSFAA